MAAQICNLSLILHYCNIKEGMPVGMEGAYDDFHIAYFMLSIMGDKELKKLVDDRITELHTEGVDAIPITENILKYFLSR